MEEKVGKSRSTSTGAVKEDKSNHVARVQFNWTIIKKLKTITNQYPQVQEIIVTLEVLPPCIHQEGEVA